jgi:hypothetical protein
MAEQETQEPFKHITVHVLWDNDRDDKGDIVEYVTAIEVVGPGPDGKPIDLYYQDEPSMVMVEFWRWLADAHGWTIDDS